jgi:dienelactone hydrolase
MSPDGAPADMPIVILFGGFDGWREEYHAAAVALAERGVAAYLTDLPRQGEVRLRDTLFLDENDVAALGTIADHLSALVNIADRVGLWGNSVGGYLAARAAGEDQRFAAVCVNGGSARPMEPPERHPRFLAKVEALTGTAERHVIDRAMVPLSPDWLGARPRCPLLQLHGAPDAVFLLENARVIHDAAASTDKRLMIGMTATTASTTMLTSATRQPPTSLRRDWSRQYGEGQAE